MPDTDRTDNGPVGPDRPSDDRRTDRAATRYLRRVAEQPDDVCEQQQRIAELLATGRSTGLDGLERRAAASRALATLVQDDPGSLEPMVSDLVEELRREMDRERSEEDAERQAISRTINIRLVRTVARIVVSAPDTPLKRDAFADFVGGVTTDLDTATLRVATRALFVGTGDHSVAFASAGELLEELLEYPDAAVRAWSAATVGRVAAEHPDAMVTTAAALRRLLTYDNASVRHNAVEALATFVGPRPDVVAPAAAELRDLLDHDDAAVQHNAAGVLARLAGEYPDAVLPAVEALAELGDHDREAVRRVATRALVQVVSTHPGATADR